MGAHAEGNHLSHIHSSKTFAPACRRCRSSRCQKGDQAFKRGFKHRLVPGMERLSAKIKNVFLRRSVSHRGRGKKQKCNAAKCDNVKAVVLYSIFPVLLATTINQKNKTKINNQINAF